MAYERKDSWYRKAKEDGYRSRAAYKLIELDRQYKLFRQGMRVLDLGCAPGGWLQVAASAVGAPGRVVGMDRLEVEKIDPPNVRVLRGDLTSEDAVSQLREALGGAADLVLSDMAPDTSGVGFADHVRSIELTRLAFRIALALLRPGGTLVAKVFEGPDLNTLVHEIATHFGKVRRVRPEATRKGSREIYLVARPLSAR